jgi:protein O-GlcNAc transferase
VSEAAPVLDRPSPAIARALACLHDGDVAMALAHVRGGIGALSDHRHHAVMGMIHLAAAQFSEAAACLRTAISLGDHAPETLLNLAVAEDRAGDGGTGDGGPGRPGMLALERDCQTWDEPSLRLAESYRRTGDFTLAERAYETVLARNPRRTEALIGLAMMHLSRQDAGGAQGLLLRCCTLAPDHVEAWDALGMALLLGGDAAAAENAFAEAARLDPACLDIAMRCMGAAFDAGHTDAELARLDTAVRDNPLDAIALTVRGVLLGQLGRRTEALGLLEAAATLAPDAPGTITAFAGALIAANHLHEAIEQLDRLVVLAPDEPMHRNNRAAVLNRMNRFREGREEAEALIATHGELPGYLCNLTNALTSLGLQEAGVATARRMLSLAPDDFVAHRTLCNALPYRDGFTGAELLAAYRAAGQALPAACMPPLGNTPDRNRKLRLGLLSSTLKVHPVGWLTIAGFEHLDPTRFEIVCLGARQPDMLQRRFAAIAQEWDELDDAHPAARIRARQIDILIDLGGYGDRGMMRLCADRLAPVQIKWVGSQNHSSGLAAMDWFITDRWETPAGFEPFYSERLLRLADGYVCFSPPAYAPDVGPLPALRNGHVTFGCFNNLAKITPMVIATWARILRRQTQGRLILKCPQLEDASTCERLRAAFQAEGVDASRVALRGGSPHRDLLDQYNDIDVVLDPFPYSGGLTTCEALWMGVPTLTVPGEIFAARHSASHMSNVGLSEWIARDREDYVARAVRVADDLPSLAHLRADLRGRVKASPLCDAPRFGRNLGAALTQAW